MSYNLDKAINRAMRQRAASAFGEAIADASRIRNGTHRVPGASEAKASEYKHRLYHYVFCQHNIPYFSTCYKCRRDKTQAQANMSMMLKPKA